MKQLPYLLERWEQGQWIPGDRFRTMKSAMEHGNSLGISFRVLPKKPTRVQRPRNDEPPCALSAVIAEVESVTKDARGRTHVSLRMKGSTADRLVAAKPRLVRVSL